METAVLYEEKELKKDSNTKEMFFLYKKGAYGHGIFWFGSSLKAGKKEADRAANLDCDDHHDWGLYKFIAPNKDSYKFDAQHEKIYEGKRIQKCL